MRYATFGQGQVGVVIDDEIVPLDERLTMLDIASGEGRPTERPAGRGLPLDSVQLGPAIPDPGAIYTVGLNYDGPGAATRPERPLIYGKAPTSTGPDGAVLEWDRAVTDNVDGECELGVVIGVRGRRVVPVHRVAPEDALDLVFGYTIVNDISSRDDWLDGDQWLLGKSMPGFCPVGPWIVTPDELEPTDIRLGCTINGEPIQDGRTSDMRFSIGEIIAFLSRHVGLRSGDLIATGTPVRLESPPGPDRRLRAGDTMTAWIEGIGALTTTVA